MEEKAGKCMQTRPLPGHPSQVCLLRLCGKQDKGMGTGTSPGLACFVHGGKGREREQ